MYYFQNVNNVGVIKRIPQLELGSNAATDVADSYISLTIDYYNKSLIHSERAKRYLKQRNIFNMDIIKHFKLGFADRTLGKSLKKLSYMQEEQIRGSLQCSGLLKPSGHEFFHGAVVFPFVDEDGKVTGAYGRRISRKLRSGSVYHLHWLSEDTTFFNLKALSNFKVVVLCKNPIDALSLINMDYPGVIGLMGMHLFSGEHIKVLLKYGADAVLLACKKCAYTNRIKDRLNKVGISSCYVTLPKGKDINQCIGAYDLYKPISMAMRRCNALH